MLGLEVQDPESRPTLSLPSSRPPVSSPRSKEWPVNFTLFSGNRIRLPCVNSDLFGDVKKRIWQIGGLKEEPSNYVFRLSNAEAFFQDEESISTLLENFILYREEGFADSLEVSVIDKKDVGDALKRHLHMPSAIGLTRLHGPLKKRSAGVHKWQQRYFALQDNTLFYFGSQEDYEKKALASEVIPMGSCIVEKGTQQGVKWSLYFSKSSKQPPKSRQSASFPNNKPLDTLKRVPRKGTNTPVLPGGTSLLEMINKTNTNNNANHVHEGGNVDFTFRIDAEVVGKREFWLRAKDNEERKAWIKVVRAVNIQRVKRIILDTTRELRHRLEQPKLLQVTYDDSKEAERLMEGYAFGTIIPKLAQSDNNTLAELFISALLILDTPFFAEDTYNEQLFTSDSLPGMLHSMPLSMRALLEHIFTFFHEATGYSDVNGLTPAYICDLMSPVIFGQETRPIHRKIITALLEKVPKLWSLLPEAYYQELQTRLSAHGSPAQPARGSPSQPARSVDTAHNSESPPPPPKQDNANSTSKWSKKNAIEEEDESAQSTTPENKTKPKPPSPLLKAPSTPIHKKGSFFWAFPAPPPPPPQRLAPSLSNAGASPDGTPKPPEQPKLASPMLAFTAPQRQQGEENGTTTTTPSSANFREKTARHRFSREASPKQPALTKLAYPLHFTNSQPDGSTKEITIRVVEELQTNDTQKFSPGRYYCLVDLIQESLGNQYMLNNVEDILLPSMQSYIVTYDYDDILHSNTNPLSPSNTPSATPKASSAASTLTVVTTSAATTPAPIPVSTLPNSILSHYSSLASPRLRALSSRSSNPKDNTTPSPSNVTTTTSSATTTTRFRSASAYSPRHASATQKPVSTSMFLPEPICLAYLAHRSLFTTMYQLTAYLANRTPMTQASVKGSVDMAWEGLERIKKLASADRRKSSGGSRRSLTDRRHSLAARHRAISQHLMSDDDDDFVDIDTAMSPNLAHLHSNPPRRPPPLPPHRRLGSRNARPVLSTTALSALTAQISDVTPRGSFVAPPSSTTDATATTTTATVATTLSTPGEPRVGGESAPPPIARSATVTAVPTRAGPDDLPQQAHIITRARTVTAASRDLVNYASGSFEDLSEKSKLALSVVPREGSEGEETKERMFKPISFDTNSTFEHVMRYSESKACFLKFLQSEYAEENLLFADEVKIFCSAQEHEQYEMACRIYEFYMGPNAVKAINVRGMSAQVREALQHSDHTETIAQCTFLFLEAQAAVLALLKFGSFTRFVASPMWEAFVDNFKQREWIRMKVVKLTKFHTTAMRVLQFDPASLTITFFKPDHNSEFTKVEVVIPPINLLNVQLSMENPKKLKISFFKGDQRLLRTQREWKIIFRTNAERERFGRLVTSNLLLRRSVPDSEVAVYKPQPLKLDKHIQELVSDLPVYEVASELHESWMATKLREGWVYGEVYNEAEHTHPDLNPFRLLDTKEQEYYLDVSSLTIGAMLELGYKIIETDFQPLNVNLEEDSRLLLLVEFLAENAHDCWAFNKVKLGWVYGPVRNEDHKTHPNLVPYVDLDEADKDWNRQAAHTVLKALLERGFKIEPEV